MKCSCVTFRRVLDAEEAVASYPEYQEAENIIIGPSFLGALLQRTEVSEKCELGSNVDRCLLISSCVWEFLMLDHTRIIALTACVCLLLFT